ncbi:hypothetical protein L208DRAFT_1396397 [Tricholoma matsutake]|nr:hypothetical protein L208DRAFT_1396397 [Tricholoma matsutake 945]
MADEATSKSAPASGSDTSLGFALCPCTLTPTSSVLDFPAAPFAVGGITGCRRMTYVHSAAACPPCDVALVLERIEDADDG